MTKLAEDVNTKPQTKLNREMAEKFLAHLKTDGRSEFTFQTFDDREGDKSLARIRHGSLEEHWDELERLNGKGAGIFVCVNPTDSKGRTKENITGLTWVYRELDVSPARPIDGMEPHIVVHSSPAAGKRHEYYRISGASLSDDFEGVMNRLARDYDSDPAAKDRSRVLRVPGFMHCKHEPHLVELGEIREHPPYEWKQVVQILPPIAKAAHSVKPEWETANPATVKILADWIDSTLVKPPEEEPHAQEDIDWSFLENGKVPKWVAKFFDPSNDDLSYNPPTGDKTASGHDFKIASQICEHARHLRVPDSQLCSAIKQAWEESELPPLGAREGKADKSPKYDITTIENAVRVFLSKAADASRMLVERMKESSRLEAPHKEETTGSEATADGEFPPPYKGVMAALVSKGLESSPKPQPELMLLSVLVGMAAGVGGKFALPDGSRCNLYGIGVADTGWGKDVPRSMCAKAAEKAGALVIGKPKSGEGLEDVVLSTGGPILCEIDEIAHLIEALNRQNKAGYEIEMASVLLRLFSASSSRYNRRVKVETKKTNLPMSVDNPCLNLIGFATPTKLGEALSTGNIDDGLLGRMLLAFGRPGVEPRMMTGKLTVPESVRLRAQTIAECRPDRTAGITTDQDTEITIVYAEDARARMEELLKQFDREAEDADSPWAKALLVRSWEKTQRIAGVLSVWSTWDPRKPSINRSHVDWAEKFVRASNESVVRICNEYLTGGAVQSNAKKVERVLERCLNGDIKTRHQKQKPYIEIRLIPWSLALKGSHMDQFDFAKAIEYLEQLEKVECIRDGDITYIHCPR